MRLALHWAAGLILALSATILSGLQWLLNFIWRTIIRSGLYLEDAGIHREEALILRRQLRSDGKSPAHINDEAVSVNLLRQIGDMLVEIQGQFEGRGLLDPSTYLPLIDRAAGHNKERESLSTRWAELRAARDELTQMTARLDKARTEEDWLRDAVEQLDMLAPPLSGKKNSWPPNANAICTAAALPKPCSSHT